MKKSTGILFLVAAALAAFVYFYDLKRNPAGNSPGDTSKPAFTVAADDISGIKIDREGATIALERRNDGWYVVQPFVTKADQAKLTELTTQLSSLRADRTLTATPAQLTSFGLDHAAVTLAFTTKSGAKHELQMGAKDFSGSSLYARVDGASSVSLLPDAILTLSDKPVDDFRDHAVLNLMPADATSFDLVNESGEVSAVKKDSTWTIEKPLATGARSEAVSALLQLVADAQISHFADDSTAPHSDNPAKYGFTKPAMQLRVTVPNGQGSQQDELQIGKKEGNEYYARDTSRPMVFLVNESLYKALSAKFSDLRDTALVHLSDSDISRVEVQRQNGAATCVKDSAGELVLEQTADKKSPAPACPAFLDALESARAQEIFDTPSADLTAKLAKPAVRATLTDASGKKTEVQVSAVSNDAVYARTSEGPQIYKLGKQLLDALNSNEPAALNDAGPPQ